MSSNVGEIRSVLGGGVGNVGVGRVGGKGRWRGKRRVWGQRAGAQWIDRFACRALH